MPVRCRCVAALFVLWTVLAGAPAMAHTDLVSTSPTSGAELAVAPDEITLRFADSVRPVAGGVRLINQFGERRIVRAAGSETMVTAPLPKLTPGAYVISWRVVSADGHPLRGAFTFRVGRTGDQRLAANAAAALFASERTQPSVGASFALAKAISMFALALLLGIVIARVSWASRESSGPLLVVGGVLATCGGVAQLMLYGPYVAGRGLSAVGDGLLLDGSLRDPVGRAIAARTVALVVLSALARRVGPMTRRPLLGVSVGLGVAAAIAQTLTGHGATGPLHTTALTATVIHVVAVSAWIGGLGVLINQRGHGIERFSTVALGAVGAVVLTGMFASWRQVRSVDGLTGTTFGRLLLVKVGLVGTMVALGARNRAAVRRAPGTYDESRRRVAGELALAVLVLVSTALLTGVAPSREVIGRPVSVAMTGSDVNADVTVSPGRRGRNDVHVYLLTPTGTPLKVDSVDIAASLAQQGVERINLKTVRAGSAHFQSLGADLPLTGTWTFDVTIRLDSFTEETVSGTVVIR